MAETRARRRLRIALAAGLAAFLLSGCASWPEAGTVQAGKVAHPVPPEPGAPAPEGEPESGAGPGPPPAAPTPPAYHPAGSALVTQARREAAGGNAERAGATLERALRVDAGNPWIWIELARLRLDAGQRSAAEGMARKALTLSSRDPDARSAAATLLGAAGAGP